MTSEILSTTKRTSPIIFLSCKQPPFSFTYTVAFSRQQSVFSLLLIAYFSLIAHVILIIYCKLYIYTRFFLHLYSKLATHCVAFLSLSYNLLFTSGFWFALQCGAFFEHLIKLPHIPQALWWAALTKFCSKFCRQLHYHLFAVFGTGFAVLFFFNYALADLPVCFNDGKIYSWIRLLSRLMEYLPNVVK